MQSIITLFLLTLFCTATLAQPWEKELQTRLTFSQTSLDNWSAGGDNTWSWQSDILGKLNQEQTMGKWTNTLKLSYGMTQIGDDDPRKSSDELRFDSNYTFKSNTFVSPYVSFALLTQLAEGKDYATTPETTVSYFFDPAYFTESAGVSYQVNQNLDTRLGGALKQTVVNKSTIVEES